MNEVLLKRAASSPVNASRWIFPYADLVTLLLAFFVFMYSVTSLEASDYKKLMAGVKAGFFNGKLVNGNEQSDMQSAEGANGSKPPLFKNIDNQLTVSQYKSWAEYQLSTDFLFEKGTAELTSSAQVTLEKVAKALKGIKQAIIIEGYTDNHPINTLEYSSNWVLSAQRSAKVAEALSYYGLVNQPMSVVGYGSQYPVGSNKTKEGRAENRRIVIVVLSEKNSKRALQPLQSKKSLARAPDSMDDKRKVTIMKEVKTSDGGVKFIKSIELQPIEEKK